jgi:Sulfatase-modifying factor enzyme 1
VKPLFVLFVFAGPVRLGESRETVTAYSGKRFLHLLAAVLGGLLIGSLAFAGELRIANPSAEEQVGRFFEKTTKEQPRQNSLGMKFVPVSGTQVLFSVWDTRVEDFRVFVDSTGYDATDGMWSLGNDGWKQRGATWKDPGFKQGSTDPVVGVSWDDAKAFCEWLTKRERASEALPGGLQYRLPTDQEWSVAVGLDSEPGETPYEKSIKIKVYPWGTQWPPPSGVGNYCGVESRIGDEPSKWIVIEGYNDGYPRTSPVGSFAANKNGLYDMGGNVWQWCEDWYNSENTHRVLRGGSWDSHNPIFLLTSSRDYITPDYRGAFIGFRCVLARESSLQADATRSSPQ